MQRNSASLWAPPNSGAYHLVVDGSEDRPALSVLHLDPDAVAELQIRRLGCAVEDGFDGADFGQTRIADAAVGHRLAGAAVGVTVRHRAGADDGAALERPRLHRV